MFSPPRDAYREKRAEILRRAFVAQTALSVFAALVIWQFGKLTESVFGAGGILLTLLSIPTVGSLTIRQLRNFEEDGWRRVVPQWDFRGTWSYRTKIEPIRFEEAVPAEVRTRVTELFLSEEVGSMVIDQSALTFRVQPGTGKFTGQADASEWHSLSIAYERGGGYINTFRGSLTVPSRYGAGWGIEGIEHVSVTKRDQLGRPIELSSTYSTAALCLIQPARFILTATARYKRESI